MFRVAQRRLGRGSTIAQRMAGLGAHEMEGTGSRVRLSDGRSILDFGTHATSMLGHRHPHVVAAVEAQLRAMPTTTRLLLNPSAARLADALVHHLQPSRLEMAWFGLNGCDAVEASLKLARWTTGRSRVLAVDGAFHGKTLGALAVTGAARYRTGLDALLGGVTHIGVDPCAVRAELEAGDVAAVIVEPVQGENGIRALPEEVLRQWADDAHAAGTLFIADEIQTGLWRCGHASLAVGYGLDPDMVLFGKALGGGIMPVSALVGSSEALAPITADPLLHTSTFSEHPLACAAGLASLEALTNNLGAYDAVASATAAALAPLVQHQAISAVRCVGLLAAIEAVDSEVAGRLLYGCVREGLLLSPCVTDNRVVRLLPGLLTTPDELTEAARIIDDVCSQLGAREAVLDSV